MSFRTMGALACMAVLVGVAACAPKSKFEAGVEASIRKDYRAAAALWRAGAEDGDPRAQFWLGTSYNMGWGVEADHEAAFMWTRRAAKQGHRRAAFALGSYYRLGHGVPKNIAKAIHWYGAAADKGSSSALVFLGEIYRKGEDLPIDYAKARGYYTEASRRGDTTADYWLGRMSLLGLGQPPDPQEAIRHFLTATRRGDISIAQEIGDIYREGKGLPVDLRLARKYYEIAAAEKNVHSLLRLADIALELDADPRSAFRWLRKAALYSSTGAPYRIAQLFLHGQLRDNAAETVALGWLLVGADYGDERAKNAATRLSRRLAAVEVAKAEVWAKEFIAESDEAHRQYRLNLGRPRIDNSRPPVPAL